MQRSFEAGGLVGALASVGNDNIAVVETYHSQYSHYKLQTILLSPVIKKVVCCSESAYNEYVHRFGRNNAKMFNSEWYRYECRSADCKKGKISTG